MLNQFYFKQFILVSHLFVNKLYWPIDRTLSGASTPSHSGPGSNGNEGLLNIHQISKVGASLSDCLESYTRIIK